MAQFTKTRASTLKKLAQLPRYTHPADLLNVPLRPTQLQKQQIQGQLEFGKNLYISQAQQTLIKNITRTRASFRSGGEAQRSTISNQEYAAWNNYLKQTVQSLPQEYRLNEGDKQKLYESYLLSKERTFEKMQMSRIIKLMNQFSRIGKFQMKLHPFIIQRIIHPHFGYLNNFHHVRLLFSELLPFMEELLVASYLFDCQHSFHSFEVLSLVFWKLHSNKPMMKLDEFCSFLELFKFKVKPESFSDHFEWNLRNKQGEIQSDKVVRFDLWRSLFLERGL